MILGNLSDLPENAPFEVRFNAERGFSREYYAHRIEGTYTSVDDMEHRVAFPGRFFLTGSRASGYQLQIETDFKQYEPIADIYPAPHQRERTRVPEAVTAHRLKW